MRKSKSFQQKLTHLSRREFLRLAGLTAGGVLLNACQPVATPISGPTPTSSPTVTPSLSPTVSPTPPPTTTLTPTATSTPTNTPSPTATPTSTSTPEPTNTPTPTQTVAPSPTPTAAPQPTTLRGFADALGIEIGANIAIDYLQDWHPESANLKPIFASEFNLHGSSWDSVWTNPYTPLRPSRDKYDFSKMDRLIAFARANNMRVQVLHLIWGDKGFLPSWLADGSYTREELLSIMQEHISTFVERYKGKIHEWSVVNEFYGGWQTNNFWLDKLGPDLDWVEAAFGWAHESDPDALLFYNDFGFEFGATNDYTATKSNQVYGLVADLVKRGAPIHGIGFQMHLDGKDLATQQQLDQRMILLQQEIQKYRDLPNVP